MEIEYFDEAIEGTSLVDLLKIDPNVTTVVVDTSKSYGTTFSSVIALKNCPLISNLTVFKNYEKKVRIEAYPFLLSPTDVIVTKHSQKAYGGEIEYVKINDIFFYSNQWDRIPVNKKDLLKEKISNQDIFYLFSAIKSKNFCILDQIKDKEMAIYKFLKSCLIKEQFVQFCTHFGSTMYLYPVYGMSEISETICMNHSLKGTTFVLNDTLTYIIKSNDQYPHVFECDLGVIKAKSYKKKKFSCKNQWIRVILTTKSKFTGNFVAFFEDGLQVIGLNSLADVCENDQQLLYFISKDKNISDDYLEKLQIFKKDIIMDLLFSSQFEV